jgi:chemotaxis protein MotB
MRAKGKRRGHEEGHGGDERWLITYADMITLLMVFFIVMYSMANTDLKRFAQVAESIKIAFHTLGAGEGAAGLIGEGGAAESSRPSPILFQNLPPQQRDFISVTSELTAFAKEVGLQGDISVNMNLEGIIISLSNALIFEPGSAELRPESMETLHEIAEILKRTNNPVRVEGHTDNVPTNSPLYPTNWELSVARAVTIVRYLVEEEGLSPDRLSAAGNAEFKAVAPNDSRANRALNRRADIVIIYPNASRQFRTEVDSGP